MLCNLFRRWMVRFANRSFMLSDSDLSLDYQPEPDFNLTPRENM
jgi:hypothetical protein